MQLPYSVHGPAGTVDIDVGTTRNPKELGAAPGAAGLAFCEAIVGYPGQGYTGLLGWIQLVRSTDNSSGGDRFELDPLEVLGELPAPVLLLRHQTDPCLTPRPVTAGPISTGSPTASCAASPNRIVTRFMHSPDSAGASPSPQRRPRPRHRTALTRPRGIDI